jgi:hypothetical protein
VDTDRGVKGIRIGDSEFMLTVTVGDAVHLSRKAGSGETWQSAVPDAYISPERAVGTAA